MACTTVRLENPVTLGGGPDPLVIRERLEWTVEVWPRETMFDMFLLNTADGKLMIVDGDEVTITVANGQATYRLDRAATDIMRATVPAYLISSRLSEAT